MKGQGDVALHEDDKRVRFEASVPRRPKAGRCLLRSALTVAAMCFCFSALLGNLGSQRSLWNIAQENMENVIDQTAGLLRMVFDSASHPSRLSPPTDSLCWPETRNLPQRTRLGVSADAAFELDSLCLPHYLASLNHYLENSELTTESKARQQLRQFLAHSWVGLLFSDSPSIKPPSVPFIIHHSAQSPTHTTWSSLNPGYVFSSEKREALKVLIQPVKGSSDRYTSDVLRKELRPLQLKNSQRRAVITKLTSLFNSGGIYVQDSAECLRPYKDWILWHHIEAGGDGRWAGGRAHHSPTPAVRSRGSPSFVVGVETSVTDSQVDWATKHTRPLTISDLAFASAPGHPILLDMMRRISQSLERSETALTDAVLQYVTIMTEGHVHWSDLREVPPEGLRFGDLLVLSAETFATSVRSVQPILNGS